MTHKTVRWGIIGCGAVTEVKSGPALYLTEGSTVSAVCRRDLTKAKDYAQRHNIQYAYSSSAELIASPEVDAVYIATPPDSHKELALQVAAAGKPCCVEKPMALNFLECQQMQKAFDAANLPLFVAYYRRSLPRFNQIKQWLDNHEIGAVRQIHWQFSKPANDLDLSKQYNWRTDKKIAPGGYFDDLASHGFDIFQYLLGDIQRITGLHGNQQNLYSAADAVTACWQHSNDCIGSGNWNFGAKERRDHVQIVGEFGRIEFSVFADQPIQLFTLDKKISLQIENPKHIQSFHVENMISHLNGLKTHPSTGCTAATTSWAMEQLFPC